jgi:hypothetical protein
MPGEWNDDSRCRMLLSWIKAKHNGFCNHINRGNWRKVDAQIRRAVKWRRNTGSPERIPYALTDRLIERLMDLSKGTKRTWSIDDLQKGNEGRQEEARQKITAALQQLLEEGCRVTCRSLSRLSGCHRDTVKRHLDIWGEFRGLSDGLGDQNSFLDLDQPLGVGSVVLLEQALPPSTESVSSLVHPHPDGVSVIAPFLSDPLSYSGSLISFASQDRAHAVDEGQSSVRQLRIFPAHLVEFRRKSTRAGSNALKVHPLPNSSGNVATEADTS